MVAAAATSRRRNHLHLSPLTILLLLILPFLASSMPTSTDSSTPSGLGLLGGDVDVTSSPAKPLVSGDVTNNAMPQLVKESDTGAPATLVLSRRSFGHLYLNFLPKGKVTPSGPSRGTNEVKN